MSRRACQHRTAIKHCLFVILVHLQCMSLQPGVAATRRARLMLTAIKELWWPSVCCSPDLEALACLGILELKVLREAARQAAPDAISVQLKRLTNLLNLQSQQQTHIFSYCTGWKHRY